MKSYSRLKYLEKEDYPVGTFDSGSLIKAQSFYIESGIIQTAVPVEDLTKNRSPI